jgi:ribosomal protein L11
MFFLSQSEIPKYVIPHHSIIYSPILNGIPRYIVPSTGTVNLRILAGVAKPSPKMGQTLGPLGVNMVKFCEEFNKQTTHFRPDVPMKVRLTAFTDRTYLFTIKPPETSWFLRKSSGVPKFTMFPSHLN